MSIGNLSKRKGGFGAGYLYNFKGSVNSPAGLPAAPDYGDIYKIILTDKMVIWDGNAWSDLSDLRGEKGDKGDKGDTGEPFQDLGLIEEENISFILDWLFQDGLYQYSVPGDGGTKTTYVIVNGNDTQGGGCRQTFIESDGNIKFRICPYKEEVWREFVPYITGEDLEEKLSEKADRQTAGGGFVGGLDAVSEDSAVSVGKGAKSKNGGFAAGLNAEANAGAGVGMGAKAYNYGGAVGRNAVAGKGFSGGDGALAAQRTHGADRVNCIQLGEGVNDVEGSLQVYGFQLMDGNGKIPGERLPELEPNFKGEVNTFSDLPESAGEGDIYRLKAGSIFSNSAHSELLVGSFDEYFDDIYGDGSVYNFQNGIDNHPELSEYFTNPDSPVAYIYTASHEYLCDTTYNQPGGYSKDFYAPIMTGDNTVAFYIAPVKTTFYTVGDLGLVFRHEDKWYPVSDVSDFYTREDIDGKIDNVSFWGGEVSNGNDLPANPVPGMFCYVSSDIANGVKYSGKVSELFRFEPPEFAFPYPSTVWFTPPDECLGDTDFSETQKQVKIYTKSGSEAGSLWITYEAYPQGVLDVTQLGAASADDTVTFYLGYWDGTSFPAKIDVFPAGSMIFWNGTEWCGVASADVADEVSEKADKIKTNPHGGIYGYPLIVTDHLAGEGPISLKVYGVSDGVGDLVASGDNTGRYAIPITIRGKNLFSTKSITQATTAINGITWT
ncbi:MAG TPA: hypothetical protein DD391_05070, partial [Clostridiales bacterium]|nr:hypothetical protein [Clostridiales bacterium]